jgi:hypothetical protein
MAMPADLDDTAAITPSTTMQSSRAPALPTPSPVVERRTRPRHQPSPAAVPSLHAFALAASVPGLEVHESSWAEWDDAYEQLNSATSSSGSPA